MVLFPLRCLFCKDHWLVGWILGELFCVCTVLFFFPTRLKDSGNVNISHYKDCPPRESTHNEVFFSHSPCPPVCLSHFRIFFLLLSFCDTLQLVFQGLLSGRWKNWQKTIFLIKLAGHRSEGLIEKSFSGLLRFGGKPTNFNIIKKNLYHKRPCVIIIPLFTV